MSAKGAIIPVGICDGCGATVHNYTIGQWNRYHACPKHGERSDDRCPDHGVSMIWRCGPWSTYRQCPEYSCTKRIAGSRGSAKAKKIADATGPAPALVTPEPTPAPKPEPTDRVEILRERAAMGFVNFYLVGPAGSGKTTLAHKFADALGAAFGALSCTAGMNESKIEGRNVPKLTTGEDVYQTTRFVEIYRDGGVFLLDEVDAADPNVLLLINAALANGHMHTPGGSIKRHEKCIIVCAANTYGAGADRVYVGRNQLDGAFMDRFKGAMFTIDYDRDIERSILTDAKALTRIWHIRETAASLKLKYVVGTRFVQAVAKMLKAGKSVDWALNACMEEWTEDDMGKVGVTP